MPKTLGYSKTAGKDWYVSAVYSDREIESIKDPEGGLDVALPTAIPTPFARIDLVKTAFRNISKTGDLAAATVNGDVIASADDERLVSQCFDVVELLFHADSLRPDLNILVWDRQKELNAMKAGSEKQRMYGEALELYLKQDETTYNFGQLKKIYIVEYKNQIVGATSPVTLFFTTANDLSRAQIKLTSSGSPLFGDVHIPLYARDPEFQKYVYLLVKQYEEQFIGKMPDFYNYWQKSMKKLEVLKPAFFNELKKIQGDSYKKLYDDLKTVSSGEIVDVTGITLKRRKKEDITGSLSDSDFRIKSTKQVSGLLPLVLQNNFNKPFRYASDVWNGSAVPYVDKEPNLEKRWLPDLKIQYPYLTVSDFLEPILVRLIYPVNKEKFFTGNVMVRSGDESKGYLLPLKKEFFKYFYTADLLNALPDSPSIELEQGPSQSVKVTLKIPVHKPDEFIYFERIYYWQTGPQAAKPDEENNKGAIAELQIGVAIFPFIKLNNPEIKAFQRVQLIDRNVTGVYKNADFDLQFFSDKQQPPVNVTAKKKRRAKAPGTHFHPSTQYYALNEEFDYVQLRDLTIGGPSGIIIPKWHPYDGGSETFTFAIDFGTTNTHIEYKVGNGRPKPFDIKEDIQIATLFDPLRKDKIRQETADDLYELIEYEFLPEQIGSHSKYHFPQRTALAESHLLNIRSATLTLADFNIPFVYEKKPDKDNVRTNLKWAKREEGNEKRIHAFFEELIMLIRNKVLMNRGDLFKTKIIWFYPSSMSDARRANLGLLWNQLFEDYFHKAPVENVEQPTENFAYRAPSGITESIAPFYYFKGTNRLQGAGSYKPVVSVDIGGGTSDIVIFESGKPLMLTSFKFAANSIFGDAFSEHGAADSHGIIIKYQPYFESLFAHNDSLLGEVLKLIQRDKRSEDITAFLFSVEHDPDIKDRRLFSFHELLRKDNDFKIIFIYFYTAVVYHIAELMKSRSLKMPKHFVFSGTGSKMLNIISPDMKILADFSKKIFEGVYGTAFDPDGLTLEMEKEKPKEVTCKGGLMSDLSETEIDGNKLKTIFTCVGDKGLQPLTYDLLDDSVKSGIVDYVRKFNEFFLDLNKAFSFHNYFDASEKAIQLFKTECNKHLRDYLEEGLVYNSKLEDTPSGQTLIAETLFFYPIVRVINNLSGQLSSLTPINH